MGTDNPPVYTNRVRAESFGSVAAHYDEYRPSYPDDLIAELVARNPGNALDIACGTGKVAVPLLACGVAVLGVEVDPKMAAVAESHGIIVEVSSFEDWDPDGRRFDLATCGQAWHWIDPVKGPLKVAEVLNPGGTLALFWNYNRLDEDVEKEMDDAYRRHAPEIGRLADAAERHATTNDGAPEPVNDPYVSDLKASKVFAEINAKKYRWEGQYTADEWISRQATHSNHILLDDPVRAQLFDALREIIDRRGGEIDAHFTTYAIFARMPD